MERRVHVIEHSVKLVYLFSGERAVFMNVTWHRILSFITIASDDVSLLAACEFCQVLLGYVFETYAHDVGESCGLPENIADFGEHQLALFLGYIPDLGVADFAILVSLGGGDMEFAFAHVLASL